MVVNLVRSGRKQPQLFSASAGGKARHPLQLCRSRGDAARCRARRICATAVERAASVDGIAGSGTTTADMGVQWDWKRWFRAAGTSAATGTRQLLEAGRAPGRTDISRSVDAGPRAAERSAGPTRSRIGALLSTLARDSASARRSSSASSARLRFGERARLAIASSTSQCSIKRQPGSTSQIRLQYHVR